MTLPCLDLVSFADGELEPERAEAFRAHLRTCAACRAGLVEAMQLGARLAALTSTSEHLRLAPEPPAGSPAELAAVPRPGSAKPRPKWKLRIAPWAGAALAAAALVVFFLRPKTEPGPVNPFAEVKTRPFDVRIAYADAASWRPTRGEMRGGGGSPQDISHAALVPLENRKDTYGLAIAGAWNGDNPLNVVARMSELAPTLSVRSDRAALEILTTSADNVESILSELEAIQRSADPVAARAAQWNYAILLARLRLPLTAAKAFRDIAAKQEPGWADEAGTRAAPEEKSGQDFWASWDLATKAANALVATGAPVPAAVVAGMPSLIRAYFYDAVRTAPSRERVQALASVAAELDRIDGQSILSDYVRRVEKLDFRRRAPLASAYAQLRLGVQPTEAVKAALTTPTAAADTVDIVMGAMYQLHVIPDHLDAYRRMVKQTGDPWFELALAEAEATAEKQRSNWTGAEARLLGAQALCGSAAITYRCLGLALELGTLYQELHRVSEAVAVLRAALGTARSSADWGPYFRLLFLLADVERFNSSTAMSRAYANEVLLMDPKPCGLSSPAHEILAGIAIRDLDGPAARRALDLGLRCREPDLSAANDLADIGRLDPRPGDLAQLQVWLATLRTSGTLTQAQRVLADAIEGRLLIESDRTAGTTLLERVIAAAKTLPRDVDAEKARTGAYSVLVFDAARHGDHARVVALIAEELGLALPGACTVGMVADDERAVVVVRSADGRDHATYETTRRPDSGPPAVSAELARGLEGCTHVQVMAQASLQGQPHVLPAVLPWSYATGAHRGVSPRGRPSTEAQTLIVTNVMPPSYLQLPALSPRAPDPTPSTHILSGPDATPARVLAAMSGASEIQFHTHALVDMGVSNASHLVLSPGLDGSYALTAEAIRGIELRGRPIIVLAACHSALGARYQHAPWSLPHAFLAAGSRAVFAAGTAIPDADAGPFFTRVLERVRAGADPAVALRDVRMATLASNPSSWVAEVILFE